LAKPSQDSAPTLLVTELWGIGDVALAIPFLRAASAKSRVTLVAKPHAGPLLARFAPQIELVPFVAPWTAFRGKYRLAKWPWRSMARLIRTLRSRHFELGASARPDPRDHVLLAFSGAAHRYGFPRAGSGIFLNNSRPLPGSLHRSDHWEAVASSLGIKMDSPAPARRSGKRIVIHAGAGQPTRLWPRERYEKLAESLTKLGWHPEILDDSFVGIDRLLDKLAAADRFIGNDSGPGHLAALLGVPTFTLFGPQLPEAFAPRNPGSQWIEGAPCPYKPCRDYCRFSEPLCLNAIDNDSVWARIVPWLAS
jgi:ADP-heptose:LPS heptosyltransferase